jgi:hypothetical protein
MSIAHRGCHPASPTKTRILSAALSAGPHSAPARVLPAPRPARNSQYAQAPSGGLCSGRRRINSRMSGIGRGVVLIIACGLGPMRKPIMAIDQASPVFSNSLGRYQAANSSAHSASCCGPRRRSGSSAENDVAIAPLAQITRRPYRQRSGVI